MPRKVGSRDKKEIRNTTVKNLNKELHKAELQEYDPEDLVFALDIGTRTVVGVVGVEEDHKFKILAVEILEHKSRAMIDGQIHDVDQVAQAAGTVKDKLEKAIGIKLSKVAIAAAGRVLKTCEVIVERDLEQSTDIDRGLVGSLEIEAIQKSQQKLEDDNPGEERNLYYCVGYSIISYFLNGFSISSLIGHKGKKIGAKVLATFLPHVVVDSLYMVMNRIGLDVMSLTLEPIAAINVTIPRDLRLLNLALVDIGAGTSDIAITREGSVVAYGMVPLAGDEITEKIAQHYLVDFNTAEKIKTSMTTKKQAISFVDILGKKHSVSINDIGELAKPVVQNLAKTISQKILEFNGKSTNAVFLIGGGSQTPGLASMIAEHLDLPAERVAVRGREVIRNIIYKGKKLSGPESITPFGIALTALMQRGQDFLTVRVNEKKIRIFNSRKLKVADALVIAGFNAELLIGRSGKSVRFELNGEKNIVKGEYGKAAEIYVNGVAASIETTLKMDDNISIKPAERGEDAVIKAKDIIEWLDLGRVTLNGSAYTIGTKAYIKGVEITPDTIIADGDMIKTLNIVTIKDLANINEVDMSYFKMIVDGCLVDEDYRLADGDEIECNLRDVDSSVNDKIPAQIHSVEHVYNRSEDIDLASNHVLAGSEPDVLYNSLVVIVNGKQVEIQGDKKQIMFVDIFNFINFDISKPQGSIVLKLNGRKAAFTDVIKMGDRVDIYWEK